MEKIFLEKISQGDILAYGEHLEGKLHISSLEILTPLKEIAQKLEKKLILVILGESKESFKDFEILKKSLADEIWFVFHSELKYFREDLYSRVLVKLVEITKPLGFFFPATFSGLSLAPRIAGVLNLGLCAHVNKLKVEDGQIMMFRPTYGENIIAKLISKTVPVMATLSLGAFSVKESKKEPQFKEILFPENFSWKSKIKVRKIIFTKKEVCSLGSAKVVVAGGRGLKNKENFLKLFELAKLLSAEVGATRPVCHEGWVEEKRMIGISGVTVKPKLYIGFGISGALQHIAGMEEAEFIVAINTDRSAPLVKMANLALIGDAPTVLKLLIERLKKEDF